LAAINFSSHFVVSARQQELGEIEAVLKKENVSYQRLPVSFAFHSRWIEEARHPFESFMSSVHDKRGNLPLVCSQAATIVPELPKSYFWDVLRRPVQFRETVKRLEREKPRRYIDLGPTGTLATFLKYALPDDTRSTVQSVLTPFGCNRQALAAVTVAHRQ
jgi:acyl transferase domain-containing protein